MSLYGQLVEPLTETSLSYSGNLIVGWRLRRGSIDDRLARSLFNHTAQIRLCLIRFIRTGFGPKEVRHTSLSTNNSSVRGGMKPRFTRNGTEISKEKNNTRIKGGGRNESNKTRILSLNYIATRACVPCRHYLGERQAC